MTAGFLASGLSEIALKIGYNDALFQFDRAKGWD